MAIGENISKIRKRLGLTQSELAGVVGVSHSRISEIEKGHGNPRIKTIEKLAEALGTTVSKLTREAATK